MLPFISDGGGKGVQLPSGFWTSFAYQQTLYDTWRVLIGDLASLWVAYRFF